MRIGRLDTDKSVIIVAEIGNNHEGDWRAAQTLVEQAAACGAHAVKFQTFEPEHFVRRLDTARFERLKKFQLPIERFEELARLARDLGLTFISTPLDITSAEGLAPFVDAFKIASGDNSFYPLIDKVCAYGKPVLISTGLSDEAQVRRAMDRALATLKDPKRLGLLHCVAAYPVPPEQANVAAVRTLATRFGLATGYSDHTLGIDASLAAVAAGARIIEKHFTINKSFSDFRDHRLSADPAEMRELVHQTRKLETLLGSGVKDVQPCERENTVALRRSIAAAADLDAGRLLTRADLTWVRPAGGFAPGDEAAVIGLALKRAVARGELILPDDLEAGGR